MADPCVLEPARRPSALRRRGAPIVCLALLTAGVVAVSTCAWGLSKDNAPLASGPVSLKPVSSIRPVISGGPGRLAGDAARRGVRDVKSRAYVPGVTRLKITDPKYQKLPDCPDIMWNTDGIDTDAIPTEVDSVFPKSLEASDLGISNGASAEEELRQVGQKRTEILSSLEKHGAVLIKGLGVSKDVNGYRQVLNELGFVACKDPLAARKSLDNEVKKVVPNTAGLGLHHDRSDYAPRNNIYDEHVESPKMPWYSAFVCFKPALEGGEFRILDGQRMVREMDRDVLKRLYDKNYRSAEVYGLWLPQSIMNMFVGWAIKVLPEPIEWKWRSLVNPNYKIRSFFKAPPEGWSDISSPPQILTDIWRCEVLLEEQSPLNRHPKTGEVVWFNNIHLWEGDKAQWKDKFKDSLGARSKAVYGDGTTIAKEDLSHIVKLTEKNEVKIAMQPGDVVLVDNYRVLHGRESFKNSREQTRLHAVTFGQTFDG
uniref:TauD/TfdA-like domain-containing protein n=1 Tax=Lotharella globosa TaxID=91324 RepID=A0A7S3YQD8_9EUKA